MSLQYRYELKYVFDNSSFSDIEYMIHTHPAMFKEIYWERSIHNIYLDDVGLNNFYDNLNGVKNRIKHRIRWYNNNSAAENPVLEYKYKSDKIGWKEFYPMPDFKLNEEFDWQKYLSEVKAFFFANNTNNIIYSEICGEYPTLLNEYKRRYYESACGKFRFTVDYNLKYMKMDNKVSRFVPATDERIVLELKFDEKDLDGLNSIVSYLNFSLSSNSKYTHGVNMVRFGGAY